MDTLTCPACSEDSGIESSWDSAGADDLSCAACGVKLYCYVDESYTDDDCWIWFYLELKG
jgi:hypothetical protein